MRETGQEDPDPIPAIGASGILLASVGCTTDALGAKP